MIFNNRGLSRSSIKEACDNLPAGMCCFNRQGIPILVNYTMDRLAFELMGHDLQIEAELEEAVQGLEDSTFFTRGGKVWKFRRREMPDIGMEYTAVDITSVYRNTVILREKNRQLKDMNEALASTARNYSAIARQEEILSMKMRIHSEMGRCALQLQKFYRDGCPTEARQELTEKILQAAALLKGDTVQGEREDSLGDLMETAEQIGASIRVTGQLPDEEAAADLMTAAMRECLMNTLRHAGGDTLFAVVERTDTGWRAVLTNNGRPPAEEITEGGGLSSLRQRIEGAGGRMEIQSSPDFQLLLTVPNTGRRDI